MLMDFKKLLLNEYLPLPDGVCKFCLLKKHIHFLKVTTKIEIKMIIVMTTKLN